MFRYISGLPMRKPLAALATLIFLGMFVRAHIFGVDIPPNASGVASTFIGVVLGGYFASSAYEAVHEEKEDKPNDGEN